MTKMMERQKIKVFKVLYTCDKLNFCLLFEKKYDEATISRLGLFDRESFIDDILSDVKYYKLEKTEGAIVLSSKLSESISLPQAVNSNGDFKILKLYDKMNFTDELTPHANLSFEKDIYHISRYLVLNEANNKEVKRILNKYSINSNIDILEKALENNSYGFTPFVLFRDDF